MVIIAKGPKGKVAKNKLSFTYRMLDFYFLFLFLIHMVLHDVLFPVTTHVRHSVL
jgi:hypothetical protein